MQRASGCKDICNIIWSQRAGRNFPELGAMPFPSLYTMLRDSTRRIYQVVYDSSLQSLLARVSSATIVKSNRYRTNTSPDLACSDYTQAFLVIAARRTCDCTEFDVELANLLKLPQVTLRVYVPIAVSGLVVPRLSITHLFPPVLLVPSPRHPEIERTVYEQSNQP